MKQTNWHAQAARRIEILQRLGFFAELDDDEYQALVSRVAHELEAADGDLTGAQVLACDEDALLSLDLECIHERGAYTQLLIDLAALTYGDLLPVLIEDRLDPLHMRAEVSFVWLGQRHHLPLTYLGSWADIGGLIAGLNAVLEHGDIQHRYYLLEVDDELAHIVYMLPAMHDRAQADRVLDFEELDTGQEGPYTSSRLLPEFRQN